MERTFAQVISILIGASGLIGCASDKSAIALHTLDPDLGIVLMRQHDSPERLVWVRAALLHLDGQMRLVDERGRTVPGVLIPGNFSAIRIDPAGRVFVGTGEGPAKECGRLAVVPRPIFDRVVHDNPNPLDAMEALWRAEPESVGVLHVGTPQR
jgi:hypothetical protein